MDLQVRATLKGSRCYMSFSHSFTNMDSAKAYTKALRDSVNNSDTIVETTLYLNTLKKI